MLALRNRFATLFLLFGLCVPSLSAVADQAPPFTLPNAGGEQVSLQDYAGEPLVLHFWATWCPYCKRVQPGLESLADEFASQGLVLLGISFREDEGVQPQAVLEERGLSFKTLVEGEEVAKAYGVRGTPTTVFIDADGAIVGVSNSSDPDDAGLRELAARAVGAGE